MLFGLLVMTLLPYFVPVLQHHCIQDAALQNLPALSSTLEGCLYHTALAGIAMLAVSDHIPSLPTDRVLNSFLAPQLDGLQKPGTIRHAVQSDDSAASDFCVAMCDYCRHCVSCVHPRLGLAAMGCALLLPPRFEHCW